MLYVPSRPLCLLFQHLVFFKIFCCTFYHMCRIYFLPPLIMETCVFLVSFFFLSTFLALSVPTWQSFMLYILCTVWHLLCWSIACCTYFHLFFFSFFRFFFACWLCFSRAWRFLNLAILLSCVRQEIKKNELAYPLNQYCIT